MQLTNSSNKTMSVLIKASIILNMTYVSIQLYQMYRDRKKKPCRCEEK